MKWVGTLAAMALGLFVAGEASAQNYGVAAAVDIGSGLEGGGKGYAKGLRRARTTLRVGGEGWMLESPNNLLAASLLLEIEPRTTAGADLRFMHLFLPRFAVSVGGIAFITPETLVGAQAGFEYRLPLGKKVALTAGPDARVFFLGTDLPEGLVIWQGIFHVGTHVSF